MSNSEGTSTNENPDHEIIITNLPDVTSMHVEDVRAMLAKLHDTPLGAAIERVVEADPETPVFSAHGSCFPSAETHTGG